MGLFDFLKKPVAEQDSVAFELHESDEVSQVGEANLDNDLDARFVDEGPIARGGMGSIRRVMNTALLRREAMKVLDPGIANEEDEVARFIEEAQITGQLDHPNIPPVHELGQDDSGAHYFTMKMVRGKTLEQLLIDPNFNFDDDNQQFQVLQVFIKVCEAIAFAHSRGVLHCDLKPPNIMIGSFGQVYVMDWGIARLKNQERKRRPDTAAELVSTGSRRDKRKDEGRVMGTLGYMSPEQAEGEMSRIDERSDVFALGALLYRILTGRAPYVGKDPAQTWELAKKAVVAEPQTIVDAQGRGRHLPQRLCRIAMKCLRAERERRYQSVALLQKEIEDFVRGAGRYPMREFKAGDRVLTEGDPATEAFVIIKGAARAFRIEHGAVKVLREMGQGDVFGETAILTDRPRTASVEATEDLTLVVVSREALEKEMGQTFWVGHILKALAERFRDVDERLQERLKAPAENPREHALRYVAFHGEPLEDGTRKVALSGLVQHLETTLQLSTEDARNAVAAVRGLSVLEDQDAAVLAEVGAKEATIIPMPQVVLVADAPRSEEEIQAELDGGATVLDTQLPPELLGEDFGSKS